MSKIAVDKLRLWREKPVAFCEEVLKVKPDPWQIDVLEAFPHNERLAMKACKGPGKTALLAWLSWNFLATRPYPKMAATSITKDNLADNLWAEMAKWQQNSPMLKELFTWTKTRIFCNEAPETWFMSARTWSQGADSSQQANTLAGLHADYIMFLCDESGGYPDAVMAAAEAALSSCVEGHIVQAGNPTHLTGPLYRACTTEASLWWTVSISSAPDDPKRTPRVKKEWALQQIQKYGRDNPWVLINVFGQFPPSSINGIIGPEEVDAAMQRSYREHENVMPTVTIGVDVAGDGADSSVIAIKKGLIMLPYKQFRNIDPAQGAGHTARAINEHNPAATFVDNTGGFGSGWVSHLRQLQYNPIPIHFSASADDAQYYNKRTEMIMNFANWIKQGGQLPNDPELKEELTAITYSFKGDKMILCPKDDIKELLQRSCDKVDASALCFAQPVASVPDFLQHGQGVVESNVQDNFYAR